MYGVDVNLRLGFTEDIMAMQSNPVDTDTGEHKKCSYNRGGI